jgi:hypothetical protein
MFQPDPILDHEVHQERVMIADHVTAHPYPSCDEMLERMETFVATEAHDAHVRGAVFQWMAEYGEANHHLCKSIYDDFHNAQSRLSTTHLAGECINERGGITAMRANFDIMANFSSFPPMTESIFRTTLEDTWHGIGDWRR